VSIELTGDRFIRQKDLTAIRLDQIRDEVYVVAGVGAFTPDGTDVYELTASAARKALSRATSRRKITSEFLRKVAEIHQSVPDGQRLAAVKAAFCVKNARHSATSRRPAGKG
jgi:hypothetical protein